VYTRTFEQLCGFSMYIVHQAVIAFNLEQVFKMSHLFIMVVKNGHFDSGPFKLNSHNEKTFVFQPVEVRFTTSGRFSATVFLNPAFINKLVKQPYGSRRTNIELFTDLGIGFWPLEIKILYDPYFLEVLFALHIAGSAKLFGLYKKFLDVHQNLE